MVEPVARIRPFDPMDYKTARFYSSKAQMEALPAANVKIYTNPISLAVWIALSSVFIQYMDWWPKPEQGIVSYLKPLPALAAVALPLMFFIDWLQREQFEDKMNEILRRPDLVDIAAYYSRSPSSGLWILQFGNRFIGLIAIDASLDSTRNEQIILTAVKKPTKPSYTKGTSKKAVIRHFYVEEPYRAASMQDDLLQHALKHAFTSNPTVQVIEAEDSLLRSYIGRALRKEGFKATKTVAKQGVLRWALRSSELTRKDWEKAHRS